MGSCLKHEGMHCCQTHAVMLANTRMLAHAHGQAHTSSSLRILQAAKALGNFLLVGLHTDEDVQDRRGPHLPIMNLHERSLR